MVQEPVVQNEWNKHWYRNQWYRMNGTTIVTGTSGIELMKQLLAQDPVVQNEWNNHCYRNQWYRINETSTGTGTSDIK